jgi:acyl transferase domain-containing protein/NADPH:quinone reductase-like Zn-dependent oxidoreductase
VDAFDALLLEGRCAVTRIPADRWDGAGLFHPDRHATGRTYTNAAGVIDRPFDFDAGFFGISRREAIQMDPQQRLLLEVAWEAIEHAGVTGSRLQGPRTGVYVGASSLEHSNSHMGDLSVVDSRFMTGNALSLLANRLSHAFDLHGPSLVIDTACSSALFALHAAAAALKAGEIDVALVGGVNLLMTPMSYVGFARASMLSPSGLCRAFDAGADGYVRAEGAVVFVLSRQDWAKAGGDRIRGRIVGSGINSDGGAGALSAPNAQRQAELIRQVYEKAGIRADDLAFVEAHGTGTAVGDPVEAAALGAALGRHRAAALPIGSVKSNVGHLEPAAGLVGLLKAQRALETGRLPPTLHVETPNPAIDFAALNLALAQETLTLPSGKTRWIAGVNSFGFGGANAHVAIAQAETALPAVPAIATEVPLVITAATSAALKKMAARWADRLEDASHAEVADFANGAAHRRDWHEHRLVVLPGAERSSGLSAFLADEPGPWVTASAPAADAAPTAFVFSGNGSQWPGMGRQAFEGDRVFREAFEAASAAVQTAGGPDLLDALFRADLAERLTEADYAQPLLFALQISLVEALAALGIRPDAVAGHSVGEVAAAWAAGALDLGQAAMLCVRRARCQAPLEGSGTMAAVLASAEEVQGLVAELGLRQTSLAADNSPRGATVSGPVDEIRHLIAEGRRRRIPMRPLQVAYPFHGPMMERIEAPLRAALAELRPRAGTVPFFSTTVGSQTSGEALDADYWWRNARQAVRFRETMVRMAEHGAAVFVEIGPQPTLQNYITDTLKAAGSAIRYVSGLRRQGPSAGLPIRVAAGVVAAGGRVDRDRLFGPPRPQADRLPTYAWDHAHLRLEPSADSLNVLRRPEPHPLLGWKATPGDTLWRRSINAADPSWLADHVIDGTAVVPGAVFAELALAAGAATLGTGSLQLLDLDILRPLTLGSTPVELRTQIDPATNRVVIESRHQTAHHAFTRHATATVQPAPAMEQRRVDPVPPATAADAALYAGLEAMGLSYGPAFRRARPLRASPLNGALTPSKIDRGAEWLLDPSSLDAAFHLLAPMLGGKLDGAAKAERLVPVRIGTVRLLKPGTAIAGAQLTVTRHGDRSALADITLVAADGRVVATLSDVRFAALRRPRREAGAPSLWTESLLPKRVNAAEPANRGAAWQRPAERLVALGLVATAPGEPSAATLVVDASCRRIVWEAARRIAPQGGVAFRARRVLPPPLSASLLHGLAALASDGIYDPDADTVTENAPLPELRALTDALLATEPASIHHLLPALRLDAILRHGEPVAGASIPVGKDNWPALECAGKDFCLSSNDNQPLEVLLIGKPPPGLDLRLRQCGARFVRTAPDLHDISPEWGFFDLILLGDGLGLTQRDYIRLLRHCAKDGLVLSGWRETSLLEGMLRLADGSGGPAPAAFEAPQIPDHVECTVSVLYPANGDGGLTVIESHAARASPIDNSGLPTVILSDPGGPGMAAAVALRDSLGSLGHQARIVENLSAVPPDEGLAVLRGAIGRGREPLPALCNRVDDVLRLIEQPRSGRIWIASLGDGPVRPSDGGLCHALRVLSNERPECDLRFVHAQSEKPADAARLLVRAMVSSLAESEQMVTPQGMLVPRLVPIDAMHAGASPGIDQYGLALALDRGQGSGFETLDWRPSPRRAPDCGEVEIAVEATGLNFRDIMWSLGVLPEEALENGFSGLGLGMECTGTVVRAGEGARWPVGARVMAFAAGAFATHVTVSDSAVQALPDDIGFTEAASLPVAVATAHYALADLARVEAGEVVLIHGAAGGVGLAAMQIALARGARVLATAGTPEKRALLTLMGASAVFDSRGLDFADGIMAETGGRGVDVALNSLAGAAMEATLRCMAPFGRFVELGKRDLYGNTQLGLRPLRRNISYFAVDLDAMLAARPAAAEKLLRALAEGLSCGDILPLPHHVLPAECTQEAFRLMQRSGHVGKIVLTPPPVPQVLAKTVPLCRPDAAWLVTGGTSGLGLAFAARLAERGAGQIWLVSRRGHLDDAAAAVVAGMRARGADVRVARCDVTDADALVALFAEIETQGHRLTGVAHAAALFDDAAAQTVDGVRLAQSAGPKVTGAVLLDRLTEALPLDHFVMFSSVAVTVGNPGQFAYTAANAAVEALVRRRRALGKPGLAVRWPPIADMGILAADPEARGMLERRGVTLVDAAAALDLFEAALQSGSAEPVINLGSLPAAAPSASWPSLNRPLFELASVNGPGRADPAQAGDILSEIASLDDPTALQHLRQALRGEAARVLHQDDDQIDANRPLQEIGFDSLMAVELRLAIERRCGVDASAIIGQESVTLNSMASDLLAALRGDPSEPSGADGAAPGHLTRHMDAEMAAALAPRVGDSGGGA